MRLLVQRTLDTGQEGLAPLSEVEPDVLAQMCPLLREGLKSGQPLHVGPGLMVPGRFGAGAAGSDPASLGGGAEPGQPDASRRPRKKSSPSAGRQPDDWNHTSLRLSGLNFPEWVRPLH